MSDQTQKTSTVDSLPELRVKVAKLCVTQYNCCRCSFSESAGGKEKRATIIKYDAPFCSEECAERASDYTLDDGQQTISDYPSDLNACAEFAAILQERDKTCPLNNMGYYYRYQTKLIEFTNQCLPVDATAEQRCRAFVAVMEASRPKAADSVL